MEESRHPNIEAELEDAMQSFRDSPSKTSDTVEEDKGELNIHVECIEYDGWKCLLVKEDREWLIYIDDIPTHLHEFGDEQNVKSELHNGLLCLRVDEDLYLLTISKDGKAKTSPYGTVSTTHDTSARVVDNERPTEEISKLPTELGPSEKENLTLTCKDRIRLRKRNNKWSLCFGETETRLDFDEGAVVSLVTNEEDTYIQADGSLYEVCVNSDGNISVKKVPEAVVVETSTEDNLIAYKHGKRDEAPSDDRCPVVPSHSGLATHFENEKDSNKSQSLRFHTEKAGKPHDRMLSQSLHSGIPDLNPAVKGSMKRDANTTKTAGKEDKGTPVMDKTRSRETNKNNPETSVPIFPDDKNAPSNILAEDIATNKQNETAAMDGNRMLVTGANHCNKGEMDSSNTKDVGAIPKTTNLSTTTVDKGDGYSVTRSENRQTHQLDDQLVRSKAQIKNPDSEKTKETKQEPIVSSAIRVDDARVFEFLKTSDIVKRMATANKVKIIPRTMSGCQGIEISGVLESMQKVEKSLKDILVDISTEILTLEANDLSAEMANKRIPLIKSKVGEKFDVFTTFAINNGKEDDRKKSDATNEEKLENQTRDRQVIKKTGTPKSVTWTFPGGYKISLCNKSIEESTATVIVKFTKWNEKEKQIKQSVSPDGFGGFINNVSVGLPFCTNTKADNDSLKGLLSRVFAKAGEEGKPSISFSLQNIQNWSCQMFVDCLMTVVWEHFKAQDQDKPVFVELCNPKSAEYQAAQFRCLRAVSEMEKDIDSLHTEELKTEIIEGKLNSTKADVLVNTTSPELYLNAGAVSAAMLKTAGSRLQDDCKQLYPKGIRWGEIAVTNGHLLPCSFVFHGALPPYLLDEHKMSEGEKFSTFRNLMETCLTRASERGCRTIAFPVLGAGNLRYPVNLVASEMLLSIEKFQTAYPRSTLRIVYIVVYPSDKHALQIFHKIQSELKANPSKPGRRPLPEAEHSGEFREDEQTIESVSVELTGLRTDVDNAKQFIIKQWRKSKSNDDRTFKIRLSRSLGDAIRKGKDDKLIQYLKDMGVEVSKGESEYCVTANTFQSLEDAFKRIDKFSVNKFGERYSLGDFGEYAVIVGMHNISKTDFKVMKKLNQSTLLKYEKNGVVIDYARNSVIINGKVKDVALALNEIEKLFAFVNKFETLCIDGEKHTISKSLMITIVKKMELKIADRHDACVLFDQTQNKLHLFARNKQTLLDMNREVFDRTMAPAGRQGAAEAGTSDPGAKLDDKPSKPIHIKTNHGYVKVFIYKEDLLKTPVDCIVSAANDRLTHGAGVAAAIGNAAGPELITETSIHCKRYGNVPAGDVVQTTAGHLKHQYKCILHAVGPTWRDYQPLTRDKLDHCTLAVQSTIHKCLDLADRSKLRSIAIPAISAGYQGVPSDICALQYAKGIDHYLATRERPTVEEIHFVDLNDGTIKQIKQTFRDHFVDKKELNVDSKYITDKSVVANANVKMTGQGISRFGDMPKTKAPEEHPRSHTLGAAGGPTARENPRSGEAILESPAIWESPSKATVFQFTIKQELQLYAANIVELHAIDAIVICEEPSGKSSGRIANDLMTKGAAKYITERGKHFQSNQRLNFGEVVVTSGGDSQFKRVFHALVHQKEMFKEMSKWYDAFQKILRLIFQKAILMKCTSIAIPVIGADSKTKDLFEYARRFIHTYKAFCLSNPTQELAVHLVSSDPNLTKMLKALFEQQVHDQQGRSGSSAPVYPPTVDELAHAGKIVKQEQSKTTKENETTDCVICLDKLENPKKLKCGHVFCNECISQHLKTKKNCPVCGTVFGKLTGNQPQGEMKVDVIPQSLPGYEDCKTIRIVYVFNGGVQGPEHPDPGKPYTGISRVAFLPDNDDGRNVLKLLQVAFDRRLTFTIGQSRTTGHTGVITWNDIHHKTNPRPNTQFGYPDSTYFNRVKDELAAKGVTEDDLK